MQYAASLQQPVATLVENNFEILAFGRKWLLWREANLEELWEKLGENDFQDERIPYWTELWPASLGLAQWLFQQRNLIHGKLCLDLGCGLGFTAIIAAWLGAKIAGCDYEFAALRNCALNAQLNGIRQPGWVCMDWRRPVIARQSLDFIWGADIIYEKRSMEPVLAMFEHCLGKEGRGWIVEPGRGVFKTFPESAAAMGFSLAPVRRLKTPAVHAGCPKVDLAIWEARRR